MSLEWWDSLGHVQLLSFSLYLAEDGPELLADEAVDEEVDGGVDDEADVGEEAEEDAPDGEAAQLGVLAGADRLQHWREEEEEHSGQYHSDA